jgi:hypothetical protein
LQHANNKGVTKTGQTIAACVCNSNVLAANGIDSTAMKYNAAWYNDSNAVIVEVTAF